MRFDGFASFFYPVLLFCFALSLFVPIKKLWNCWCYTRAHSVSITINPLRPRKKWSPFRRRHFQMHFLYKYYILQITYCVCCYKNSKHRITMCAWQNNSITWYYVFETHTKWFLSHESRREASFRWYKNISLNYSIKRLLKLGHVWVITSHCYVKVIAYPCLLPDAAFANLCQ